MIDDFPAEVREFILADAEAYKAYLDEMAFNRQYRGPDSGWLTRELLRIALRRLQDAQANQARSAVPRLRPGGAT